MNYASIVKSAGNSRAEVTHAMTRVSYAGRGVLFLALALSIYQIATAENKVAAFKKELALTSPLPQPGGCRLREGRGFLRRRVMLYTVASAGSCFIERPDRTRLSTG